MPDSLIRDRGKHVFVNRHSLQIAPSIHGHVDIRPRKLLPPPQHTFVPANVNLTITPTRSRVPSISPAMDGSEIIPRASPLTGRKPNKTIPVPSEFRRDTHARERDVLVNDIKVKTDCQLVPHWEQGKICRFDIYGPSAGVEKAVALINKWISNAHVKSKDSSAWAKLPAFDVDDWYYEKVAEMEGERKKMFLGPKPDRPEGAAQLPNVCCTSCDRDQWSLTLHRPLLTGLRTLGITLSLRETSSVISWRLSMISECGTMYGSPLCPTTASGKWRFWA